MARQKLTFLLGDFLQRRYQWQHRRAGILPATQARRLPYGGMLFPGNLLSANLTIYFSRQQLKNRDFRGPDFFLVKQTQNRPRKSWVVGEEDGKYLDLIIRLYWK